MSKPGNGGGTKRANQRTSPSLAVARRGPSKAAQRAAAAKSAPADRPQPNAPAKTALQAAEPPARRPAAERAKAARAGSSGSMLLILILGALAVSMVVALPTVPIVLLGMIPTAVAAFVERGPYKIAAISVAGLNFAGVAPFVAVLWRGPNTLYHSFAIIGDVYSWLAMYGAAAVGWLLCLVLPPVAASILKIRSAQQIAGLQAQQAKLREEWEIGAAKKES